MKKRIITHTYESLRKQKRHVSPTHLKEKAGGVALRAQLPP